MSFRKFRGRLGFDLKSKSDHLGAGTFKFAFPPATRPSSPKSYSAGLIEAFRQSYPVPLKAGRECYKIVKRFYSSILFVSGAMVNHFFNFLDNLFKSHS